MVKKNYAENMYGWMKRNGLAEKYEHPGIYCIKINGQIVYIGKSHNIYNANGFDIALVQRLLQHSSAATTQRYIGIEPQKIEQAIQNHAQLL